MEIKHFGLIGCRLGHSFSQEWFSRKFAELGLKEYSYELFELPSVDGLKEWALRMGLSGFNVTVPYKLAVIPQLDDLDEVAAAIGAVNCVTIENERLIGHNTDAPAFQQTLDEGERKAFVMGTGGAARAVAYALEQRNIDYKFVSRTPEKHPRAISYDEMRQEAWKHPRLLIVNATPVGMYPEVDSTPLGLQAPEGDVLVYDLIYNPSPTRLLREAAALGMRTKNGLEMLHLQADLSWKIWENKEIGIKN